MLQALLNILLYIPSKIYGHFDYIHNLERENEKLERKINKRDLLFKRISSECEYNMQINNYSNG